MRGDIPASDMYLCVVILECSHLHIPSLVKNRVLSIDSSFPGLGIDDQNATDYMEKLA